MPTKDKISIVIFFLCRKKPSAAFFRHWKEDLVYKFYTCVPGGFSRFSVY
jgi:hypothetical protein